MNARLVIAGAHYFDGDHILIPHYTGEYWAVDCTAYKTLEEIISEYSKEYVKSIKLDYIEHDGKKYYYGEWGPYHTENMELLSDLSNLTFQES
jgi:hypothetical protein